MLLCVFQWQQEDPDDAFPAFWGTEGGTSLAGFCVKNPFGFNKNPIYAVGITG